MYTFAEWSALKGGQTTLSSIAAAAEAVGVSAILSEAALVAGAGLTGFAIGEAILKGLQRTETMPLLKPSAAGGTKPGLYNITVEYESVIFGTRTLQFQAMAPYSDVTYFRFGDMGIVYFMAQQGERIILLNTSVPDIITPPHIVLATRVDGQPDTQSRMPNFAPALPAVERPLAPYYIPVPGTAPPIEINPVAVPQPSNDPDTPDYKRVPGGVIVQIPETGQEIVFTPQGVSITPYKAPQTETSPTRQPPTILPPLRLSEDTCPCPSEETDLTEVVCRLKALQSGLLDDGYTYNSFSGVSGQGGMLEPSTSKLFAVNITVVSYPSSERTQNYGAETPTVFFIGYFCWVYGSRPGERSPISYLQTSWLKPEGATGYMFAVHNGCTATSQYVTRTKKPFIDNC